MINIELKKARGEIGLTQVEVARKANISALSYQRYETGKRIPNAYVAQRIAKAVNSSVEELFTEVKPKE